MSTTVTLDNEPAQLDAIKAVRDDNAPENWVVWGHVNQDTHLVSITGSGSGGLAEMVSCLAEDNVHYCLYRTTEKFDMTVNVKFVYIYFVGESVPGVKKGKIGVVKGDVKENYFHPYHITIESSNPSELTDAFVEELIAKNSGKIQNTKDYVPDFREEGVQERSFGAFSPKPPQERQSKFKYQGTDATKHKDAINVAEDVQAAIEAIRGGHKDWVVAGFENNDPKKQLVMLADGQGSIAPMLDAMSDDGFAFGLVRVIDEIDGHPTVKYVFVWFMGETVSIMKKGKLTPMRGSITEVFAPYQVDFDIEKKNEISDEIIAEKVGKTSGSRSNVK